VSGGSLWRNGDWYNRKVYAGDIELTWIGKEVKRVF
jgi:hypothetical protein